MAAVQKFLFSERYCFVSLDSAHTNSPFVFILQDYYSIPFPTPTTPLTGRDGSLSSNPYSGREKDCSGCMTPSEVHAAAYWFPVPLPAGATSAPASCTAFGLEHVSQQLNSCLSFDHLVVSRRVTVKMWQVGVGAAVGKGVRKG